MDDTRLQRRRGDLTLAGFVAAMGVVIALAAAFYWLVERQRAAAGWVNRAARILSQVGDVRSSLHEAQVAFSGGRPAQARVAIETARARASTLSQLLADGRSQSLVDELRANLGVAGGDPDFMGMRGIVVRIDREERALLGERLDDQARAMRQFQLGSAAAAVLLLVALAVLYIFVRRRRSEQQHLYDAEQRFHAMTSSIVDYAVLMLDPGGRVLTWNQGARRIVGYEEAEIVGRDFSVFHTPEARGRERPQAILERARTQGRHEEEGWRVRRDGSRFWADVSITAMRLPDGRLAGFCEVTRDLTERRRAEEAQRLADLSRRLLQAQEEERRRLARELHDETGQALNGIRMSVVAALAQRDDPGLRQAVEAIDGAIEHLRGLALSLRPPMLDDLGLAEAIQWTVERQSRDTGWKVRLHLDELPERLSPEAETACYRICQEALTNAARHADAHEVRVALRDREHCVELEVADDGVGFDPARFARPEERLRHFGLVSMGERAALAGGELTVESSVGGGTRVRVSIPRCAAESANEASMQEAGEG